MTSIAAGGTLSQQLYMRLFDRINTDGDDALSVSEVSAAHGDGADFIKTFNALDANADGRVMRAEMTPSSAFGAETLGSLIAAQSDGGTDDPASFSTAAVADLFKRADLDGDGALSADEMKAEGDLRRAASLDAGYMAGPMFMTRDKNDDGLLTQDEVTAGKPLSALKLPASAVRFFDEMSAEEQERFQATRERMGLPPLAPLSDEEKGAQRAQWEADSAERASGPDGTLKFLDREIDDLRTQAGQAFAEQNLSDSLSRRLLQQVLSEAWKT